VSFNPITAAGIDLERANLSKQAKAEVLKRVQARISHSRRVWYCQLGRNCDGTPHEGAEYPHAQDYQYPPLGFDWDTWFMMCGRGTGKTLSGSHWVRSITPKVSRIALVGRTLDDTRKTMVEGESGLIRACKDAGETYDWKPALKTFTFANGAQAFCYTAEEPDKLRGPEHGAGWLDEPCHMELIDEIWSNYNLGLRQKGYPGGAKTLLTSSPLPVKWTKERIKEKGELHEDGSRDPSTVMVSVPTSRNIHNLDESYIRRVVDPLRGTRKGRQELNAELLEDVEGALWTIDSFRYFDLAVMRGTFDRIVVGVDPAGSTTRHSDETGIIVVAIKGDNIYVLDDFTGTYSPAAWAAKVILAYETYSADAVVVERNFGGDMVKANLRNAKFRGRVVEARASEGKRVRAEPTAALYEQELAYHARGGKLQALEDEQTTWVPGIGPSPNRIDALVWAEHEISKGRGRGSASSGIPRGQMGPPKTMLPGSKRSAKAALQIARPGSYR
jgi:phage terminase large subunit-like protein